MTDEIIRDLYNIEQMNSGSIESSYHIGIISEKDKLLAAKQILLGLACLYVLTLLAYMVRPTEGNKLLDICMTTFPPIATLILVAYFRDKKD